VVSDVDVPVDNGYQSLPRPPLRLERRFAAAKRGSGRGGLASLREILFGNLLLFADI
jgi:hypothetical protein